MMAWPKNDKTVIKSINKTKHKVSKVEMLGSDAAIPWSQNNDGLHVTMPAEKPCEHAFVLEITM